MLYAEDGYVYTIEGNALTNRLDYAPDQMYDLQDGDLEPLDHVVVNRYPLEAPNIHGYGIPDYDSRTPLELEGFVDLGRHSESAEVYQYVCDLGIMAPTSSHTFSPEHGMTRGAFIMAAADFFGLPNGAAWAAPFDDVDVSDSCYTAVMSARAAGLVDGVEGNLFQPDLYISPEDARTILDRAVSRLGLVESFNFSAGDYSYLLTPYTIRADIAQAFYTLCQRLPLTELSAAPLFLGDIQCPARTLDGVYYVPAAVLEQLVPGLEAAVRPDAPDWESERVVPGAAVLWYGNQMVVLEGFEYQGTQYVELAVAAGVFELEPRWGE